MATTTTNYGLTKPSYGDNADIAVINSNMDKIDAKMKEIEDAGGSGSGSSVEWNQIQTSGTKIAEVTIDGTKKDVYAPAGATPTITVDAELNTESENPVQNKVISNKINELSSNLGDKVDKVSGKGLSTNDYTTAEKEKLAGIETGANKITVDAELSTESENPVQNKVITTALNGKQAKITVASGTATWNTTYGGTASSRGCYWRRYGRMVTVYIYEAIMTPSCKSDGSTSIIATGLPKAAENQIAMLVSVGGAQARRVGIAKGGTSVLWWWNPTVTANTASMNGSFTYLCE